MTSASTGRLIVISAPSGTGKTTVVHALLAARPAWRTSVSCTTRAPRPGERNGVDYHFIDAAAFERMIQADGFLEWAEVHGHRYGTPAAPLRTWQAAGHDVLLDIDVQGAQSVKQRDPQALLIFLRPPSMVVLEQRLRSRGTEDEATIRRRLARAQAEMAAQPHYDRVVTNETVEQAVREIVHIVDEKR